MGEVYVLSGIVSHIVTTVGSFAFLVYLPYNLSYDGLSQLLTGADILGEYRMPEKIVGLKIKADDKLRFMTGYDLVDWLLMTFLIFIFCITLVRATVTQVTFDEAQTYLQYCKPDIFRIDGMRDIYWNSYANNHLLNTYLIVISEFLFRHKYSEFLIRLPQLLFYLIFLKTIWILYKKKYFSAKLVIFLTANYYISEFYGLARGYAMACTLVFLSCISLYFWKQSSYETDKYLIMCSATLALAVMANTISFLLLPSFGFVWLFRLIQKKRLLSVIRRYLAYLIIWTAFMAVMVKYHMNVIAYTTPEGVYTGREKGFFECFFAGYAEMYTGNEYLKKAIGVLLAVLIIGIVSALLYLKKLNESDFVIQLILFLVVYLVTQYIFKVGYPTGRELIPFWPLLVLALYEGTGIIIKNVDMLNDRIRILDRWTVLICVIIIFIFLRRIDVTSTTEWNHEYGLREHMIKEYIAYDGDEDKFTPIRSMVEYFYMWKMDNIKYSPTPFD